MSNSYVQTQKVANAFLLLLKNQLVMGKLATTEFDKEFSKQEVAIGDTVKVRRSPQFTVRSGATASPQDLKTGSVDVTIDKQRGVDLEFTSKELTLDVDQLLKNKTMKAQAAALAQTIDKDLMTETLKFPHWVGTPGNAINTAAKFFTGPQRMDELAIPSDDRHSVLSPTDFWALAGSFTGLNIDSTAKKALERAKLPIVGNVQPYMSQNVMNITTGTRHVTSGAIDGADQDVTYESVRQNYQQTLNLKTVGNNATIKAGEVFTIDGVYAVNPSSRESLGYLQEFTVLEDATADGTGDVAVTIANPIITSGAYQTVTAAPADSAGIDFKGVASTPYRLNAMFHRGAIGLVGAKLVAPESGKYSFATDPETGLSLRYWRTSDGTNDKHLHRVDVLYGTVALDTRLGIKIAG